LAVRVTPELLHEADLILTMTDFHRRMVLALFPQLQPKLFTFADFLNANAGTMNADADEKRVFGEVVDPYGGPDEVYALCAAQLNTMTAVLTDLLCEPPNRSAGDGSV
jgi:protein-tyrosine-phosphatase